MESQLDYERVLEKIKKKWNEKEDEKLVAAMLDVLNSGSNYKSDNGFKPAFYNAVHKNAAKWRGKKFPHYWDLCIVFGKDRANGRDAQTAADILSDINREEQEATGDGLDDIDVNQPLNNPSYVASREESSTQRKRKKRNSWDPLMNSLKESAEIIEMNKVEGLTTRECDKAVCKLAQNEELMVIFYKVDKERKLGWVKNMLDDTA
ncbi:hypothetical protein L1987_48357 [Smallanthus sonchifolius]|uniref:Uncharacterized protein n=1 Tax=Smallanthus sonchifolius TaxID=185202 RepID=A0ACB9FRJ2_9ASTR|nr:hypothetical protein L1987_48357 [Smallanthus sonchifolius]